MNESLHRNGVRESKQIHKSSADRSYPHLNLELGHSLRSGVRKRSAGQFVTLAEVEPDSFAFLINNLNRIPESMQGPVRKQEVNDGKSVDLNLKAT